MMTYCCEIRYIGVGSSVQEKVYHVGVIIHAGHDKGRLAVLIISKSMYIMQHCTYIYICHPFMSYMLLLRVSHYCAIMHACTYVVYQ
jgi:hypothetical protein